MMYRFALPFVAALALAACKKSADKPTETQRREVSAPERDLPQGGPRRVAPPDRDDAPDRFRGPDRDDDGGRRAERRKQRLEQFDADGDGQLSEEEKQLMRESREAAREERRAERLAEFDADGDGTLSAAERATMRAQRTENRIAELDADGDGKLSATELEGARGPMRRMLEEHPEADADGDGFLTADEVHAAMAERRRARRGDDDRDGGPAEPPSAQSP